MDLAGNIDVNQAEGEKEVDKALLEPLTTLEELDGKEKACTF